MAAMKKVISFSLWGSDPRYVRGAVSNAIAAKLLYPGWVCRFYIDWQTVPTTTVLELSILECELIDMVKGVPFMMNRFLVADDKDVERFIVRDCDSRITTREVAAVKEWIDEDLILHVMRDHPAHQTIPGGLWGGVWRRSNWEAPAMRDLLDRFLEAHKGDVGAYQADQDFLLKHVWSWAKLSVTIHDSDPGRRQQIGGKRFPTPRNPWPRFVGEVVLFDENGNEVYRDGDWQQIRKDDE
jgi:hypothetical protein